jgi:hypothetical protein
MGYALGPPIHAGRIPDGDGRAGMIADFHDANARRNARRERPPFRVTGRIGDSPAAQLTNPTIPNRMYTTKNKLILSYKYLYYKGILCTCDTVTYFIVSFRKWFPPALSGMVRAPSLPECLYEPT